MTQQLSREQFIQYLRASGLFTQEETDSILRAHVTARLTDGEAVAQSLVNAGKLTAFQAEAVAERRFADLVLGSYQVLDRLGAGGMGTVFKARHQRMKRVVAIKVLSPSVAKTEQFVQRFQREVEAVACLSHPNIVMAYDAGEAEAGHFLVMEFINGRDLATEVRDRGALPIAEAVQCTLQAAQALNYAHGQGIIHRDIKPANLLKDISGVVKVADLGLARFNDAVNKAPDEMGALTQAGTIMGTVDYMPPEQALGLASIDHRADIYSLGCTLYFLLTGKPPYQGTSLMATLLKHREGPIPSLVSARREIPAALDQVFQRMVGKKPEDRYSSMAEVIAALEKVPLFAETLTKAPKLPASPVAVSSATVEFTLAPPPAALSAETMAPVSAKERPSAGASVTLVPAADTENAAPKAAPLLLVEPSRSQAVIIRSYLQKLGFADIVTAPSGEKAFELARATPPQAIISAMHLADMTGVQLAQKMRAEKALASVGFILITSQTDAAEAEALHQAGHAVHLPKPFDLEHLAQALAATGNPPKKAPPALDRLRVLVVDDSSAARSHIRSVLAGLGLRYIKETVDGAEAIALLARETFDLVVTDYNMPRLDGLGLLDFIRNSSSTPKVPVIMVTTETDPAKLEPVRKLGVAAICEKSFKPEVVRGILERLS